MAEEALLAGGDLCLLMIDIDHCKEFNDRYGHQTGDRVLQLVAGIIDASIRDTDVAARYGGEELAVILPGTRLRDAASLAERMCAELRTRRLVEPTSHEELARITLSIGVAAFEPENPLERLVTRADQVLYGAKEGGRDRVVVDGPQPPP